MKKQLFLPSIIVLLSYSLHAQYFIGLRGSAYGGVTNVDYNPAIADSRYMIDINLIGVAATVNNNYVGVDHRLIYHPALFNDPNLQDNYLHERINGRNKSGFAGAQIQGPLSFMVSFGKKKHPNKNAIAFTWHSNFIANADNINETLARIAYYGLGSRANAITHFIGQNLQNINLASRAAAWNDFGITYSRIIWDDKVNVIKVGGTLKLLQPMGGAYAYVKNLNYQWTEYNILNIYKSTFNYAYSQGLVTSKGYSAKDIQQVLSSYMSQQLAYKNAAPTVAVDMGFIYEWRPEKAKYSGEMDCECKWTNDKNHYKIAAGLSVMDIGALRFKRGQYSENFYADIRSWDVAGARFPDGLQSVDDTIRSRFQQLSNKNYFTLWLPTRFNVFVDYNIINDFGVLFSANVSPELSPKRAMLHQVTTFTINPKFDHKWVGIYLPLSYDVMGNFSLGITLRAGPLIIGTQDILGLFVKKYVYNADIHAALKITIPYLKKCGKGDVRFNKHTGIGHLS
jgi:hypothetical protein